MGYIMDLRKYVGHQPIMMVSACVLILNEKKKVLLQKKELIMVIGVIQVVRLNLEKVLKSVPKEKFWGNRTGVC